MLEYDAHHYMFDSLGDKKFDSLCHQLITREFGDRKGYIPGPRKGRDGGFDSKYGQQQANKPSNQFKFREIGGANGEKLRKAVIRDFENWLKSKCTAQSTGTYLFITNVHRTDGDHRQTDAIMAKYPKASIYYWDFDKLSTLMETHQDLYDQYLKILPSQEVRKQRTEIEKKEKALAIKEKEIYLKTPEFVSISLKFKTQFIDFILLAKTYHGFLYIVEPVYMDNQDGVRATMRELFQIDETTEGKVLETLKADGRIDITGNVITVNKVAEATAAAKDMVDQVGPDLQKVISLIQGV
jgi:hypothetical protein